MEASISALEGKACGEQTQVRALIETLERGEVLVGDSIYENYWTFVALQRQGVEAVFEINTHRHRPAPGCKRLRLARPQRPPWMDKATYAASPEQIIARPVRSRKYGLSRQGADSHLRRRQLGDERRCRRALPSALAHRGVFCFSQTRPRRRHSALHGALDGNQGVARVHLLLAYNIVRLLMSEAARRARREPRTISFRHAQ